jgi:hypothetical protein
MRITIMVKGYDEDTALELATDELALIGDVYTLQQIAKVSGPALADLVSSTIEMSEDLLEYLQKQESAKDKESTDEQGAESGTDEERANR